MTDVPRRLHPYSLLFRFCGAVNTFFIPALLVWWFADDDQKWEVWLAALFLPVFLAHVLHYITLRYAFADDELVVRKGLIFRSERHLPYARIENVDLIRNPVHRFLGVAQVRIDTASGDEAEAVFRVLKTARVAELLREIESRAGDSEGAARAARTLREIEDELQGREAESPGDPDESTVSDDTEIFDDAVARLRPRELIELGVISNRGLLGLAAIAGLLWRFDVMEKLFEDSWIGRWIDEVVGRGDMVTGLVAVVVGLVLIVALSILWTFIRYYGYRLEKTGDLFHWSAGSWTHVTASIPARRIQKLTVRQTLLHRMFRRAAIRVETVGGGTEEDEKVAGRSDFVPLCRIEDVARIVRSVDESLELPAQYERLHPKTARRMTKFEILTSPLFYALAIWLFGWVWGFVVATLFTGACIWIDRRRARWDGFATTDDAVFARSMWLGRKWIVVPTEKIQVVALGHSPFDRRWGMATLTIDSPGARAFDGFEISYVEAERARRLYERLAERAASAQFAW